MNEMFDIDEQARAMERMFIWDSVTGVGFPLTPDILTIDIEELSLEERIVLSAGTTFEIDELIKKKGDSLINQFVLATRVFSVLVKALVNSEPVEKRQQYLKTIRQTLAEISENGVPDDD